MLVFSSTNGILPHMNNLLYSGDYIIYNLCSLMENIPKLELFIQPSELLSYDSKDFDIKYYNFIINVRFLELMKIILPLYYGKNVIILISNDIENNIVSESLQKLIQQRYGILSYLVYEPNDFLEIRIDKSDFSIQGLYNLDMDKERYIELLSNSCSDNKLEEMQRELENNNLYK